jgi:hypothetical protein
LLEYLRNIIEMVAPELYAVFESDPQQRLHGRDESDWPTLATALGLACAVGDRRCGFLRLRRRDVDYKSNRDFSQETNKVT